MFNNVQTVEAPLLVLCSNVRKNVYNHRVKSGLTTYDLPEMVRRGAIEMPMPVSTKAPPPRIGKDISRVTKNRIRANSMAEAVS